MASGGGKSRRRVMSAARIQIKVPGLESFAEQFKLTREGLFIQTKKPLPVGREVALRVVTVDAKTLFIANSRVSWTQPPWREEPHVAGMGLQFQSMPPASRWVLDRLFGQDDAELLNPSDPVSAPIEDQPVLDGDELMVQPVSQAPPAEAVPQAERSESIAAASAAVSDLVVGIDLGTTFTCAAVLKFGKPIVISLDDGHRTMPSVVTISTNDVIVGRTALEKMASDPKHTVYGAKRLLGRKFNSVAVKDAREYFDYEIVEGEGGDAAVRIDGHVYSLPWISSRVLAEVKTWVRHQTGENVCKAIITVPAHYNTRQRQAVIHAAREAGLKPKQIVNEPTAAAVAYGMDRGFEQRVMVYDLGGGTFDVAVLELQGNMFEVLATAGDPYLGGNDFDNRIVDWLIAKFRESHGIDLTHDKVVKLRLRQAAEAAKRELSENTSAQIYLPYVAKKGDEVLNLYQTLTREHLNKMVSDLVDRTLALCEKTLTSAHLTRGDIDEVLLVGGQTRMPLVDGKVAAFIGRRPRAGVHPDEAVAIGAATLARTLDDSDHVALNDLVSQPIGIAFEGRFRPIIRKNSALPADKHVTIPTLVDNQRAMSVDVYQGDSGELDGSEYLGTVEVRKLPARPKGQTRVQIHFEVDHFGFLTVYTSYTPGGGRRRAVPMVVKNRAERL